MSTSASTEPEETAGQKRHREIEESKAASRRRRAATPTSGKRRRRGRGEKKNVRRSSSPTTLNERRVRQKVGEGKSGGQDYYGIEIKRPGGYEELTVVNKPGKGTRGANIKMMNIPEDDLVVVSTDYAGVNYADVCVRWGLYTSAKKFVGWPITPGFEFSGTVMEVGANVVDLNVGDKVFGVTMFGGYSNSIVVPRHQLFPVPDELTLEEAAAFPAVALTAWYAMFKLYLPVKGQTVLVHSAAGGVGSMLVQLGKSAGLRVVGVVGASHKVKYCLESLHCDHVIDKSTQDLWKEAKAYSPDGYDAIFDANGYTTLRGSYDHLAAAGRLVVYGFHSMLPRKGGVLGIWEWVRMIYGYLVTPRFNPLDMTAVNKSLLAFNLSFLFDRKNILQEAMGHLMTLVKSNRLRVAQVKSFPMCRVADAHRTIESGLSIGKLVLNTKQIV